MQVPIGLEEDFKGLVDLVQLKAYYFNGSSGSVSKDQLFTLALSLNLFLLFQPFEYYIVAFLVKRLLLKKFHQILRP